MLLVKPISYVGGGYYFPSFVHMLCTLISYLVKNNLGLWSRMFPFFDIKIGQFYIIFGLEVLKKIFRR